MLSTFNLSVQAVNVASCRGIYLKQRSFTPTYSNWFLGKSCLNVDLLGKYDVAVAVNIKMEMEVGEV